MSAITWGQTTVVTFLSFCSDSFFMSYSLTPVGNSQLWLFLIILCPYYCSLLFLFCLCSPYYGYIYMPSLPYPSCLSVVILCSCLSYSLTPVINSQLWLFLIKLCPSLLFLHIFCNDSLSLSLIIRLLFLWSFFTLFKCVNCALLCSFYISSVVTLCFFVSYSLTCSKVLSLFTLL